MLGSQGLTLLTEEELKKLLSLLHREQIECPLTPASLACVGFQHRSEELLGTLRGLDARAVRAVVVCVLAERQSKASTPNWLS